MNPAPLVSVLMNCYNGEKYLREAVDSVLAQSYQNWEVIFWDNQSTDNSASIFKSYSDPRLRYFYAPRHTWLYEARNYAIEKASGEFVAFLDVDDQWLPEKLMRQLPLFDDPAVGFVCGNFWVDNERRQTRWASFRSDVPTGNVLNVLLKDYFVGLLTLVVRRSALESLDHPCDPRYHIIGDFDLVIRLSIAWKMDCVQEPIAISRLHDGNETARHAERKIDEVDCWVGEMKQVEAICSAPNARIFESHSTYLRAKQRYLQGDRRGAIELTRRLPWGRQKVKLCVALLLPVRIARQFSPYLR